MRWISENYKWLFDGIGGAIFIFAVGFLLNRRDSRKALLKNQQGTARLSWPEEKAEYIATSSESIPPFPRELSGYRSAKNRDFWNRPFQLAGSIRLFKGDDWRGIPNFPLTMNGCSAGIFMIRWRSANPNVRVHSSARHSKDSDAAEKAGFFGYMSGTNCEQPMFRCGTMGAGDTLVDVYYELKFWRAAP